MREIQQDVLSAVSGGYGGGLVATVKLRETGGGLGSTIYNSSEIVWEVSNGMTIFIREECHGTLWWEDTF